MALRKFSKYMKWISIVVIFSMVLSAGYGAYNFIARYINDKTIVKVDGIKIDEDTFNKKLAILEYNVKTYQANVKDPVEIDEEVLKIYTLSSLLNDIYTDLLIKGNKIKVSKNIINEQMSEYEKQAGGKQQLALVLQQQGENINTLYSKIERQESLNALQDKISETINVDNELLLKYYENNKYTMYDGKNYEEVEKQVKKDYTSLRVQGIIAKDILDIANNAKVEFKVEEYKPLYEKTQEILIEDLDVKEIDLINGILNTMISENISYDEAKKLVLDDMSKQIVSWKKYEEKAKELGIEVDTTNVSKLYAYMLYTEAYINNYLNTYEASDEQLQLVFNLLKAQYNKPETATGNVLKLNYTASTEDEEKAFKKAEEIKKEVNKDNFEEKAKEYSKDPGTKDNGGNLGKQNISTYVKEFAEAVKNEIAGNIIGPVKTQFGYHIIYVVSVDENDANVKELKHILIPIEISDKTKEEENKKLLEIKEKLEKKSITVEDISKKPEKYYNIEVIPFNQLTINTPMQSLNYDLSVNQEIFKLNAGEFGEMSRDKDTLLIDVTEKTPFIEAKFEDYKNTIRVRMASIELSKELQNF